MTTAMLRPTELVHNLCKNKERVTVWLMHDTKIRIEGVLEGWDEFMNLVLSDAYEHHVKANPPTKESIGRVLLKGDTVGLIHPSS
jgi:small nuclear ribonucleoprotein E